MRRLSGVLGALLIGVSATSALAAGAGDQLVYFGTHGSGAGAGIFGARLDEKTGHLTSLGLAAEIDRPTWLVPSPHGSAIYSTSETGNDGKSQATVYSLSPDPATGKLSTLSKVESGGGGATHLDVDGRSHTLFVANYGTGSAAVVPIGMGSVLAPVTSVLPDSGTGPHPRQKAPHAHSVLLDPSGRFLLVADLGADRVFVYHFDPATRAVSPADPAFATLPPGSGPRHMVFSPDGKWLFLDTELTGEVVSFAWDSQKGALRQVKAISALPEGYTGEKSAAEIVLSKDGRYLYVSTRGDSSITAYAVNQRTGELKPVQRVAAGGKTPWSIAIDPTGKWLLSANEASNLVTEFKLDAATGKMTQTQETLAVPMPVAVAFPNG